MNHKMAPNKLLQATCEDACASFRSRNTTTHLRATSQEISKSQVAFFAA